ncbi:MAG TPA: hypothetical protein V6D29_08895 [Leptolyngbyaceae cyanobacterium]
MPDQSSHQRQTAAREFMRSLGQLETVLQSEATKSPAPEKMPTAPAAIPSPPNQPRSSPSSKENSALDWEMALEDAAADIEQFMNTPHEP